MRLNEFAAIENWFAKYARQRSDVVTGIGDDGAVLRLPVGKQLVAATDTLVAGVHFSMEMPVADIAYKSLAVNLSDMAAMGAEPAWVMLALTVPDLDATWLDAFCQGFAPLLERFNCQLIGGDLTRGPLSITWQVQGFVPSGKALYRKGAQVGDYIFLSGQLGAAGLGVALLQDRMTSDATAREQALHALYHPEPRVQEALVMRNLVTACIDVSDGVAADLQHILTASQLGADLWLDKLPLADCLLAVMDRAEAEQFVLGSGDDYELCFTVGRQSHKLLRQTVNTMPVTCIGEIVSRPGLRLLNEKGDEVTTIPSGYQHFATQES